MNAIVVLSFNHSELTTRCLRSVESFFNGTTYVVHNGTSQKEVERLKEKFSLIKHITLEKNRQFSGGANVGLSQAFLNGAKQVLFLSNDTELVALKFPKVFETEASVTAVAVELRQTQRLHSLGGELDLKTGKLSHLASASIKAPLKHKFYVPGAAFVITKEAWQKLRGFDESLGSYWEDVDLSLRAQKMGATLKTHSEIRVKHGVAKTSGGNPLYSVFYFHRNQRRVCLRHGTLRTRPLFLLHYSLQTMRKFFKYASRRDGVRFKWLLKSLR